jgi:hypothetical protein
VYDPLVMKPIKIAYVVTTIQHATKPLLAIAEKMKSNNSSLYIVGDKKTPLDFSCKNAKYLSVLNQEASSFSLSKVLPWNSYSRKMIGYLSACQDGYDWIRETDDDNFPLNSFFDSPEGKFRFREVSGGLWVNPYSYFTSKYIWPRGYPIHLLDSDIQSRTQTETSWHVRESKSVVLFQGLANGEPDVDAIFRLIVSNNSQMEFLDLPPVRISKDSYAPFNSQATTWAKLIFPLMYLPITCTFRMTDIWRSFVAQRILREIAGEIIFTSPTVFQERNPHNLLKDFAEEVPGYLENDNLVRVLDAVKISGGVNNFFPDLRICYKALIDAGHLDHSEMESLDAWIKDLTMLKWDPEL